MSKKYPNSLCKTQGHEWRTTASARFRVCARERCRAAERLDGGQWVDATVSTYPSHNPLARQMQRAHQAKPEQPRQLDFLDVCKRSAPLEIGLYSREEEREAQRRYYRLLGR